MSDHTLYRTQAQLEDLEMHIRHITDQIDLLESQRQEMFKKYKVLKQRNQNLMQSIVIDFETNPKPHKYEQL